MAETSKRSDRRLQILNAAREVFARYGYEKATLEDIGQRCGLNKASLYYYFRNKEELFARTVLEEAAAFMGELQEGTRRVAGAEAKVKYYVTERLRYYGEVVSLHQLSLEQLRQVEPLFEELYAFVKKKEIAFLAALLEEAEASGEIAPVAAEGVAASIFFISDAFKQEAMRQSKALVAAEVDFEGLIAQVDDLIRLLFTGLYPRQ